MTNSIQTTQMNWARFIGLIQTDGSFAWFWDRKDRTFRPRVILSAGTSNRELLTIVKQWLEGQDIVSQFQETTESCNLFVERQAQVQKVIKKIDETTEGYPTLLVDSKLVDYLALKYALKRTKEKANVNTPLERQAIFRELLDLKMIIFERNQTGRGIDMAEERKNLEQVLGVSNTQGLATPIYNNFLEQADQKGMQLVNQLQTTSETCDQCSEKFGQYIVGVMDGDGSFQVGFHRDNKRSQENYEFAPMFTLTDGYVCTKHHTIFDIFNQFFGNKAKPTGVAEGTRADRLYIKSRTVLSKLVSFTKKLNWC